MAKMSKKMAMFEKKDKAADKKMGVKEGSKRDAKLDMTAKLYRRGGKACK